MNREEEERAILEWAADLAHRAVDAERARIDSARASVLATSRARARQGSRPATRIAAEPEPDLDTGELFDGFQSALAQSVTRFEPRRSMGEVSVVLPTRTQVREALERVVDQLGEAFLHADDVVVLSSIRSRSQLGPLVARRLRRRLVERGCPATVQLVYALSYPEYKGQRLETSTPACALRGRHVIVVADNYYSPLSLRFVSDALSAAGVASELHCVLVDFTPLSTTGETALPRLACFGLDDLVYPQPDADEALVPGPLEVGRLSAGRLKELQVALQRSLEKDEGRERQIQRLFQATRERWCQTQKHLMLVEAEVARRAGCTREARYRDSSGWGLDSEGANDEPAAREYKQPHDLEPSDLNPPDVEAPDLELRGSATR